MANICTQLGSWIKKHSTLVVISVILIQLIFGIFLLFSFEVLSWDGIKKFISFGSDGLFDPLSHKNFKNFAHPACEKDHAGFTYRIHGGFKSNLLQYQFIARLIFVNGAVSKIFCGGALINKDFVLTAAHCLKNFERQAKQYDVKMIVSIGGSFEKNFTDIVDFDVKSYTIHANFRHFENDIGLIKLSRSAETNSFACLPFFDADLPNEVTIVGFTNESTIEQPIVYDGRVKIVNNTFCSSSHEKFFKDTLRTEALKYVQITESQFCLDATERDTEVMDSGLPVVTYNDTSDATTVHGIVSSGIQGGSKQPGIYTNVRSYLKWILDEAV